MKVGFMKGLASAFLAPEALKSGQESAWCFPRDVDRHRLNQRAKAVGKAVFR